jgi:hypothetical protein
VKKKISFPKKAPKGVAIGNERWVVPVINKLSIELALPSGWKKVRKTFYGTLGTKTGTIPFIGVIELTKHEGGKAESLSQIALIPKIEASAGKAGGRLFERHFPLFFAAIKENSQNREAWMQALALDCAKTAHDPTLMGTASIENADQWKAFQKAMRGIRKTDDIDFLLANRYILEGWNKEKMRRVASIVTKRLKLKKALSLTVLKRRLYDLGLQGLPEGRPQNKYPELKTLWAKRIS